MNTCKKYQKLIQKIQTSPLEEQEMNDLKEHCKTCEECNSLLTMHNELSKSDGLIPMPDTAELQQIRQSVLRSIRLSANKDTQPLFERLYSLLKKPAFSYSFAVLCLVTGLLIGKYPSANNIGDKGIIVKQIEYVAEKNHDFSQVENSPYTYSNIFFENVENDQVHLSFNVSTHIDLVRPKTDPLVTEILAQSLINPEQTGYRIRNMSYAEKIMDPKIKETLIFSLKNDPAMPVRLKALINLMKYKNDEDIQSALLDVIREEESVQIRLLAIDYLTENNIDASLLNQAAESSSQEFNTSVLVKTRQYGETKNHF
jgi:hypothetical protein